MIRHDPYELFDEETQERVEGTLEMFSCSTLCLSMAIKRVIAEKGKEIPTPTLEDIKNGISFYVEGYRKLSDMNKTVKWYFPNAKYHYFKKNERVNLDKIGNNLNKAIICVKGHYIYVEEDKYYSFFDNLEDEVVAIWVLEE